MQQDIVLDKSYGIAIISAWLVFEIFRFIMAMEVTADPVKEFLNKFKPGGGGGTVHNKNNTEPKKKDGGAANPNLSRKAAGSNWESANTAAQHAGQQQQNRTNHKKNRAKNFTKYVAMDCEMVGIGHNGQDDMLARVSIVNQNGEVLLDKFVQPRQPVTDYRTKVSGVRPRDIENGENFEKVQNEVLALLRNKILVGHSIHNDLAVLYIKHPNKYIRDTAKYRPLAKLVANGATPSLKRLSKAILGVDIQTGEHSSVEDARAAMSIYNRFSVEWERYLKKVLQQRRNGKGRS